MLIAGNWKMFRGPDPAALAGLDAVVCPPFTRLRECVEAGLTTFAQNVHWEKEGAYTGEISAPLLKELGVVGSLVGHSERRQYFGETDETVAKRAQAALAAGLRVIACVGETHEQREVGETEDVLRRQLSVLEPHPDLVLAQTGPENRGPVEALARLGIPVEAFTLGTVEQIESAIRGVGRLLGNEREGDALAAGIEARRASARKAAAGKKRVRALLVFGVDPLVVAGPSGYPGQLLDDLGIDNAARGVTRPFARLSVEAAVQAAPDVLVLAGVDPPQRRPVVPVLARVRVAALRSQALLHPGPRLVEAIDDLEEAVRGIDPGPRVP